MAESLRRIWELVIIFWLLAENFIVFNLQISVSSIQTFKKIILKVLQLASIFLTTSCWLLSCFIISVFSIKGMKKPYQCYLCQAIRPCESKSAIMSLYLHVVLSKSTKFNQTRVKLQYHESRLYLTLTITIFCCRGGL